MPATPKPAGGPIANGLYELTQARVFNATPEEIVSFQSVRLRYTIRISQGATLLDFVVAVQLGPNPPQTEYGTLKMFAAGTTLTTAQICPIPEAAQDSGYSATASELTVFDPDSIITFTKR